RQGKVYHRSFSTAANMQFYIATFLHFIVGADTKILPGKKGASTEAPTIESPTGGDTGHNKKGDCRDSCGRFDNSSL
ncbi:MAG: hypothetical protein RIN56_15440, partial [Sporomusaceae bacterium]|nr:hypothetical protein [Sporomusaceae bacterium]